jgi:hypothetical protein
VDPDYGGGGMIFEIWERETANLVGSYETEAEALRLVRDLIDEYGPDSASSLLLGCEADNGQSTVVAEGQDLVSRALLSAPRA